MRFSELTEKEIICCSNGARLGYVEDLEFNPITGKVEAMIVPACGKFFNIFGSKEEYVVPWCEIQKLGEDIILVNSSAEPCAPRQKK